MAERDNFVWRYSEDILGEYKAILRRMRVRPGLIGKIINLIRDRAEAVQVRAATGISPDPKDDPFCFCAEQGGADLIFTLNTKDFPQNRLTAKIVFNRKSEAAFVAVVCESMENAFLPETVYRNQTTASGAFALCKTGGAMVSTSSKTAVRG